MSTKTRIYSDSCCFIEAVKHRRGIPLAGDADEAGIREADCWFFRRLCDASRDGVIQLVTSMLSVAECLHVEESGGPSKETRDLFVEFLTSGTIVDLIEPDIFVAERARDLLWNDGVYLKGADCFHVATALLDGCSELLTLDGRIKKQSKFSTAIPELKKIGLAVLRPSQTNGLPNEYRTDDLFKGKGQEAAAEKP
jgi:predicted nucleic acid-binding protein